MVQYHFLSSIIKYFTILLELLLGIRVVLKFLGANPLADIVRLVYGISDFFASPFKSIFPNIVLSNGIIDLVAISAMVGYLIAVLIILKLLKIIFFSRY